jgi:fucose permease
VLNIAIWTAAIGFPIYWLSEVKLLNLVGLYVVGIGVANLFPMCLSIASDIGVDRSDAASARVSLAGGSAILILPQILGSLADQIGIFNAFSVIAILLVILTSFTVFGGRLRNLTLVQSTQ